MIDSYLREFDRWVVADPERKAEYHAELEAHLREAEKAGDLLQVLERLGDPREAARSFGPTTRLVPAPIRRRLVAAAIDHAPFLVVSIGLAVLSILDGPPIRFAVPAMIRIDDTMDLGDTLLVVGALAWSIIGIGLIETRSGRTPGKALLGLQTVSADGTAIGPGQGICRRVPLSLGPLVFVDLLFVGANERRQRLFDLLTHTVVVLDPGRSGQSPPVPDPSADRSTRPWR